MPEKAVARTEECGEIGRVVAPTKNQRPLLAAMVDDDPSLCKALGRLLTAVGIQFVAYSSAEAFLEAKDAREPDCLLLDIQLEGMSGVELQQQLITSGRRIPVVFITAHDEPKIRAQAERSGCVAFLTKADPGEQVLAAVGRAIEAQAAPELQTAS